MTITYQEIRPMNDDVLLIHKKLNDIKGGVIEIKEDEDQDTSMYFTVLKVGPKTKHVAVGDVVCAAWRRLVPPFVIDVDGREKNVTLTSEKEILGIVEGL